ncbi:hypothetical protein ABIE44_001683 [Marmoricola sp. OAE513]|uniref:hypothetical protein n=1 Tax=Marmoricola sp. OAE513 TaxID=2817894 RepID=UPI001D68A2F5
MNFSEAELTAAITGTAKAALASKSKDIRKGRVDVEQAWADLGGFGRYQLIEPIGSEILPFLLALPDIERVVGERPGYTGAQIRETVEALTDDEGGKLRRKALVLARVALVTTALAHVPPWPDPDKLNVPDSLGDL